MTHTTNTLPDLDQLLQGAQRDGLSGGALDLVVSNLNGPTMTQAVGVGLDQLGTSEVTLAMNIIDRSSSMDPYAADLMRAYNDDYLRPLAVSPSADDLLVSTILFDDKVELLHGYVHPADAARLSDAVYRPRGTTALYDAVAGGLTNMVVYSQQLRQSGINVRGIVLVYTDGEDNASRQRAQEVKRTVVELLAQELYSFALIGFTPPSTRALGFNTGGQADPVRAMADAMGFREALSASFSPAELSRLFFLASRSAVMTSQGRPHQNGLFAAS